MKKILLIATGGTIASKDTKDGLQPLITSDEIITCVPAVARICDVSTIQLFNIDSTNMQPSYWIKIAECIEKYYSKYDGFVITHGTDTMAYATSIMSYLIQHSRKPIVFTGSQKSIYKKNTDAKMNLLNAFLYAADDHSNGVCLVFDGKVIAGTRARKVRTKSYNAFSSIDYPELAVIRDQKIIRYIKETETQQTPTFYHVLDDKVFVLKVIPGMDADIFSYLETKYDALIVESFGVGGVPCYENEDFIDAIERWIQKGKTIIMTTQVPHEGSDMAVYQVGFKVKEKYELIEAYNMTLEAVVTKLMWILAQTKEAKQVRKLFYQEVNHDIL